MQRSKNPPFSPATENSDRPDRRSRRAKLPLGVNVVIPKSAAVDWGAVERDPEIPVVVTNSKAKARRLCARGCPAIAILGVTEKQAAELLQLHGATAILRKGSAH